MVYQLPSSFQGGMQGAVESLKKGTLPQSIKSPVLQPTQVKQTFSPPKPTPVDPNKTPEAFKKRFIEKHGDGVAEDGRKYSQIPAQEIVAKVIRKYGDGVTTDGIPYRDFLPRPASPNDSLEYRLSQIESLSTAPKSQFYTDGAIRGQTKQEEEFTTKVKNRQNEGELMKTLKAPYRAVYSAMETPSQGLQMAVSDVLDLVGADETSKNLTKQLVKDKFEQDMLNQDNKGLIGGIQAGSPSSIIGSLVTAIPNLLLYANPVGATAGIVSTGGGLSLEGEMQGQKGLGDKAIAYSAGTISGLIDRISGQKFIDGLLSKGIEKRVAKNFVDKTSNFLKTLKPSDFEAGTEVIQQKIENWGRQLMGTEYDKGWKQYAEAGLMGKILGKVSDVGQSQAPITTLPPAAPKAPRVDAKNIETLKTIKVGKRANNNVIRNEERGFDPYTDIATHQEIVPSVDKTGLVRTTEQVQNLEDTLDPINDALTQSIKDEGVKISLDEFLLDSMNEAKQYENEGASYDRYVNQIKKDFEVYKRFTDEQGRIDLSKINEIKKAKYGISNFSDVESDKANKMVGKAAKELVEKYTTGESTKAINRELSRWYSARDLLLAMDGKTVKGGRLGKMAARVGGNIIGSYFGPLGSFAGGEISAAVQGQMMKGSLRKPSGTIDSESVLSKIPKRTTPQLPPPSGKPTSAKVVDVKPITGFLPGLLQKSESALSRQISSNNTEDKTTQSQLVRVLGGKRKKEVVLPKKESAGKKVNNPIIQKLAKKQETPKIDPELESLQKSQESLPGLPKVEVPADYTPTDGLPTGPEFEAPIISSLSKGKIPSPDVKRPQIRGIDLGIRSNMIDSLKQEGIFTDSFFAITDKNLSKKFIDYAEQKAIKKGISTSGKEVSIRQLLDTAKNSADTVLTPTEYVKGLDGDKGIYLRFDISDGNKVAINSSYADIFFKNFDDVTFKGSNEVSPVIVYSKGKDVGVIMPIKDPYGAKEVLGDFAVGKPKIPTPKTPQVEGKTVEKIKAMQLEQEDMIRKGESISEDFRNKWNDLQSQYKKEFIDSRIASERKKVDSAIRDIETKIKENPSRTDWGKKQIQMEEEGFNRLKKGDYFEKKYQEHISKIREEAKNSSLLKSVKNKPSLPLSQKSEVKEAPKTPQVEGKTTVEVLKEWKPTKGDYSIENIDIKNTNAFPRSQYHRPEYINTDSYKYWLEQAKQGKEIPPIVVEKSDKGYHILDGYHRIAAAEDAGVKNIKALVLDTPIDKKGKPFTKFTDEELKNIASNKQSLPLSSKSEVKEAPKTPQVEGETLEQGTFGGVKGVQPKNQAKFNQGDNFEPVRVVMNDKDARIVRYGAIRGRGLKKGFTSADNAEMKGILDELNITREEAINRSDEIKKLAREARSAKEEVILDLTKKPSLPLSSKSEVKYSKPIAPEKAIKEYTNDSTKINKAIRSGDINEKVMAIDKFLEQQPTYDMQTYRGLTKDADKVDEFVNKIKKEGYSDEAYTSSSKSYGDALTFSRTSKSEGKVGIILEIEGKNGKIIPSKYNAYNEEEVIYPRGSKFEFVEEYNRGGQRVIILKQK